MAGGRIPPSTVAVPLITPQNKVLSAALKEAGDQGSCQTSVQKSNHAALYPKATSSSCGPWHMTCLLTYDVPTLRPPCRHLVRISLNRPGPSTHLPPPECCPFPLPGEISLLTLSSRSRAGTTIFGSISQVSLSC